MSPLLKAKLTNTETLADKYITWATALIRAADRTGDQDKKERFTECSKAAMKKARLLLG